MSARRRRYSLPNHFNIPEKANRVLNLILFFMFLLLLRIWHLGVIQHDARVEEAQKPKRRVVVEPSRRATIRDRYNYPLAINKIQYNASILYSQLRSIPAIKWIPDASGKRVKHFKRKEYITQLSQLLANELQLDADRLEDLIHSKAALYYHLPFTIKEDISEHEYYRLKMLEKDWLGIQVQRMPRRTYPRGKVGADVVGYMGAINREEFEGVITEIKALDEYISALEHGEEHTLPAGVEDFTHAKKRLKELRELAYTVNDYVGKTGVEGYFEETLRGFQGKKSFYSDAKGNFLRELPGSHDPIPGERVLLSISAELQEFAEELLIKNERIREAHLSHGNGQSTKQPWIKGGAIVAMDPTTGEVVAMASYPRHDPNDFIVAGNPDDMAQKRANIVRWFESEEYIGQIWDQKRPIERERLNDAEDMLYDESVMMTWDNYLNFILPADNAVYKAFKRLGTIKNAVELQKNVDALLALSGQDNLYTLFNYLYEGTDHVPYGKRVRSDTRKLIETNFKANSAQVQKLESFLSQQFQNIPNHYDKVLLVDLCRVIIDPDHVSEALLSKFGNQTLTKYRNASAAMASIGPTVRGLCKTLFHDQDFHDWRKQNEQQFLKEKRAEEKLAAKYPKPYIDYLDNKENQLFSDFWTTHKWDLISFFLTGKGIKHPELEPYAKVLQTWQAEIAQGAHQELPWYNSYKTLQEIIAPFSLSVAKEYMSTLRGFHELNRPLYGKYRYLRKKEGKHLEKHLAAAFYPMYGFGYSRSHAFRQATTQGSIFKLVTAYAALTQRYKQLGPQKANAVNLNPLNIVDTTQHHGREVFLGSHASGALIPQHYKGGRLPKSQHPSIGKLDIIHALETSSNPYFALIAGDFLDKPEDLTKAARLFSYGKKTGIELPGEIAGKIPQDITTNKTGLYSLAIGQHSLVVTPLQTAVMISAIANGGKVLKPKIVRMTAGSKSDESSDLILCPPCFKYRDELAMAGVDFPLFTAVEKTDSKGAVKQFSTEIKRELFMPTLVRKILLEGMQGVVSRMQQSGLSGLSRFYRDYPDAISDYIDLKEDLVGKTSTAESVENIDLDALQGTNLYTHVGFGGIAFNRDSDDGNAAIYRDEYGYPELVVVVYLRYGRFGKEAAPIAAQVIKKWREIKAREEVASR